MIGLTAKQAEALRFIAGYIEAKGCAPTYEEIAAAIGVRAKSGVFRLTEGLRQRGAVTWHPNRARSIEVLRPVTIPRAPNGAPLYFVEVQP